MTTRRFVHEKTLELNLSAEVLVLIRSVHPTAYLIGMTQERENRNGIDSAIQAMGTPLGAIQYKAALRPKSKKEYWFSVHANQLKHLHTLETYFPGRVAYFLPRVNTKHDLRTNSPHFPAHYEFRPGLLARSRSPPCPDKLNRGAGLHRAKRAPSRYS